MGILCAKLILLSIAFDPLALSVFAQPKALPNQMLGLILAAFLIVLAVRWRRLVWSPTPIHLLAIGLTVAYVVAAATALDHRVAVFGSPDRQLGLLAALDNFVVFAGVAVLVRRPWDLVWLGASLAGAAIVVVAYEVVQFLGLDPISWARPSRDVLPSTIGNRGAVAQYLGTVAAAAFAIASLRHDVPRVIRIAAGALALVTLGGALLSGARAVLIGLIVGAVYLGVHHIIRAEPRRRRMLVSLAVIGLATGIALLAATPTGRSIDVLLGDAGALVSAEGETTLPAGSVGARLDLYRIAGQQFMDRPLLGVGPDNYVVAFPRYRTPDSVRLHDFQVPQSSTHSWVAKVATDGGAIGLLGFLALAGTGAFLALRSGRAWPVAAGAGLAAFLGTGVVTINHVATDWLPWFALGVIALHVRGPDLSSTSIADRPDRGRGRSPETWPAKVVVAAGVLAILASVVAVREPLEASRRAKAARELLGSGNLQRGLGEAGRAVTFDPGRADYRNDLGLAQLRLNDAASAADSFREASRLAPYQVSYLVNLVRAQLIQAAGGDRSARAEALETARAAVALDPHVFEVQYVRTVAAAANGQADETIAAAERLVELGGFADASITQAAAAAYLSEGRPSDAEKWVRRLVPTDAANNPGLRVLLARALAAQDRVAEALAQVDLALQADPDNEAAKSLQRELTGTR